MRGWLSGIMAGTALLVALSAQAAVHVRGAYQFETTPEPAFVTQLDVPVAWPTDAPGASEQRWRYWRYDVQSDHRNGHDVVYVDHVYEVRTASLLGDAGRFQIGFRPEFQKLRIHRVELRRDGVWTSRLDPGRVSLARREGEFEQDIANGAVTALIVLDDVRVGDVVRVSYSFDGANPVLAGQQTDWFRLGFGDPVLDLRARALYDRGTRLAVHRENTELTPAITTTADGVVASIERHAVPAITAYGNYPRWYSPYPAVQVGREQSWAQVVDWAVPLYPPATGALPADLEERIVQWRALPSPEARLTAALRAVQDEVRYFGLEMAETTHRPHPPHETWTRRFGDCKDKAYLLSTILARLGIPAVPALVSTSDGKAVARYLPSADAFDHVIVRASLDGSTVWVDPTMAQQGGSPRHVDLGELGVALPVAAGTTALADILRPADAVNGIEAVSRFTIERADAPVAMTVDTTYRGAAADRARRSIASERSEDLSRRYAEFYGKRYGRIEAVAPPRVEDDRAANLLRTRETYRLVAPLIDDGNGVRRLEVYADTLATPSGLPASLSHPGPLYVGPPAQYRESIEVVVPADWSARFGDEQGQRSSAGFDFERKVERDGSTTRLTYDFGIKRPDIAAKDVPTHLDALRATRDDLGAGLRFQLPAAIGQQQRDDRLKALLRDAMNGETTK